MDPRSADSGITDFDGWLSASGEQPEAHFFTQAQCGTVKIGALQGIPGLDDRLTAFVDL